jgi:cold shock CspA family protein
MGRSQETFGKKEKEKKRLKKRQDKSKRKEERKANPGGGSLDDMIAYVDENGMITDTPPDITKKRKIDASTIEISVPKKEDEDPIRTGRVEFFNTAKGYGFIKDLENQEKYFVHVNGLLDQIKESDKVTFELEKGLKGMMAVRVKKA